MTTMMISEDDDCFDPVEFEKAQSKSNLQARIGEQHSAIDVRNPEDLRDERTGFKMTKGGFYLKESDDEDEVQEVKLSKKQRKKLRRQLDGYSNNSDDSTEETLSNVNVRRGVGHQTTMQASHLASNGPKAGSGTGTAKRSLQADNNSMCLPNTVSNSLKKAEAHIDEERVRNKDKSDRATIENCLDPRTMI